jgi:hypothetical protein
MSDHIRLISTTIEILDEVKWDVYGDRLALNYLTYIDRHQADEVSLMDSLLGSFLERVLGYTLNQNLFRQASSKSTGKRPDYLPVDTHLHPFVFDAKGSDTVDLSEHWHQIDDYVRTRGLQYGVLANMRDLLVYVAASSAPEECFTFSFQRLYHDYASNPKSILQQENTRRFLTFVDRFQCRRLDDATKVQSIIAARHDSHDNQLVPEDIVAQLRRIVRLLHDDVRRQRDRIPDVLRFNTERQRNILHEIHALAQDTTVPVSPDSHEADLTATLASPRGTMAGATDRYLYRVAYFVMTKLLLARTWEDIGFIEQALFDGGFASWYEHYSREIAKVVDQSFHFAKHRYSWLYGVENNYTWFHPSESVLIDVLYELSRYNFAGLDADVLGAVYEEYLDIDERKNKGQYYTPRSVVGFIWDRVGFTTPQRQFRYEGGRRTKRVILDFCTGSGGFLVEAARRIRETALPPNFNPEDPTVLSTVSMGELNLALTAIIEGLRGSEIMPFAYYLTEVNLLIQLTPLLSAMRKKEPQALPFGEDYSLALVNHDSLSLHNSEQSFIDAESTECSDLCERDQRQDILDVSDFKRTVRTWLKTFHQADYVCSNPPYVGEKGHKDLFRDVLRTFPYWQQFYQGKMDYLYWFIILGLSKLRHGGRLGYITTGYWHTADGASQLRGYILKNAKILEMIDFGETKIFSDAPGQHNMIFVLERCDDKGERDSNFPRLIQVKRECQGTSVNERLANLLALIQEHIGFKAGQRYEDEILCGFWSPVPQGSLTDRAWHIFHETSTEEILQQFAKGNDCLNHVLNDAQGIVSGADKVVAGHFKHLQREVVDNQELKCGDGIFVVTHQERTNLGLSTDESKLVKRTYKNSQVGRYTIDVGDDEPEYLLYVTREHRFSSEATPQLFAHLDKFRGVLERKRECRQYSRGTAIPTRYWYELHWPRKERLFNEEKLVTSRRSPSNCFAYGVSGWYENSDLTVLTRRRGVDESIKYFLAILNSAVIEFWCEYRGKKKGKQREYYSTPLQRIPIRRIRFDLATPETKKLAILDQLREELEESRYESAANLLSSVLNDGQEDVVHDALVMIVDEIISQSRELATYNDFFGTSLIRLNASAPLPSPNLAAFVRKLPDAERWSIQMHLQAGSLKVNSSAEGQQDDFYCYRVWEKDMESVTLRQKGRGGATLTLTGDGRMVAYLQDVLELQTKKYWREVKHTEVPKDMGVFQDRVDRIVEKVTRLRAGICGAQHVIDSAVLDLYGITETSVRTSILTGQQGS